MVAIEVRMKNSEFAVTSLYPVACPSKNQYTIMHQASCCASPRFYCAPVILLLRH
jgi:hypothetical protein